jgi:hypothetical protein
MQFVFEPGDCAGKGTVDHDRGTDRFGQMAAGGEPGGLRGPECGFGDVLLGKSVDNLGRTVLAAVGAAQGLRNGRNRLIGGSIKIVAHAVQDSLAGLG